MNNPNGSPQKTSSRAPITRGDANLADDEVGAVETRVEGDNEADYGEGGDGESDQRDLTPKAPASDTTGRR